MTVLLDALPRPTWSEFTDLFRSRWQQGEHVFINGQTGSGKTELLLRLGLMRGYTVIFVTKPKDGIFRSKYARHYKKVYKFDPGIRDTHLLLTARKRNDTNDTVTDQRELFAGAMRKIFDEGGWTVGVDETLWIGNRLGLGKEVGDLAFMGRALGITEIAATQRPRNIPVIIPQSATYAFIARSRRKEDRKTLTEIGGGSPEVLDAIESLADPHDFLFIDTQDKLPIMLVNTHK